MTRPPASRDPDGRDVDAAVELARADLLAWRGSRFLVTGATGFVGSWLLCVLARANRDLDLDLELVALARRPERLPSQVAAWASVTMVAADVRHISAGDARRLGAFDAVAHLACPSSAAPGSADLEPSELSATIVEGTRAALRLAAARAGTRVLVASSGAVHGFGPERPPRVPESCQSEPPIGVASSAYGLAKRTAERDAVALTTAGAVDAVIARLWAFVGPLLPLDAHFAAGNFVADALAGRPIEVKGNPQTVRSYLYPVDLVAWMLAALTRGRSGVAYNIGSEQATTIGELAGAVAALGGVGVEFVDAAGANQAPTRYVPDTSRARHELGARQTVGLEDAIARTVDWHRQPIAALAS